MPAGPPRIRAVADPSLRPARAAAVRPLPRRAASAVRHEPGQAVDRARRRSESSPIRVYADSCVTTAPPSRPAGGARQTRHARTHTRPGSKTGLALWARPSQRRPAQFPAPAQLDGSSHPSLGGRGRRTSPKRPRPVACAAAAVTGSEKPWNGETDDAMAEGTTPWCGIGRGRCNGQRPRDQTGRLLDPLERDD